MKGAFGGAGAHLSVSGLCSEFKCQSPPIDFLFSCESNTPSSPQQCVESRFNLPACIVATLLVPRAPDWPAWCCSCLSSWHFWNITCHLAYLIVYFFLKVQLLHNKSFKRGLEASELGFKGYRTFKGRKLYLKQAVNKYGLGELTNAGQLSLHDAK